MRARAQVSQDKLTARYGGEAAHSNDVGAAQGDCCEPRRAALYYYELRVINAGRDGAIAIGFSQEGARLTRQPGWDPNSYGYHGDDGRTFHNKCVRAAARTAAPPAALDGALGASALAVRAQVPGPLARALSLSTGRPGQR